MSSFSPLPTTTSQLTLTQDGQQAPLILVDGVDGLGAPLSALHVTTAGTTTFPTSQLNLLADAINVIVVHNRSTQPVSLQIATTGAAQDVSVPVGIGQWAKFYLVPLVDLTVTSATVVPLTNNSDAMDVLLYMAHT